MQCVVYCCSFIELKKVKSEKTHESGIALLSREAGGFELSEIVTVSG